MNSSDSNVMKRPFYLTLMSGVFGFFKKGVVIPVTMNDQARVKRIFEWRRWSVFLSITFGYGIYYVGRLSLSVVKKPLMEQGILDASLLGIVGSALFFAYAGGKLVNGFLADRANIKRFMSLGLLGIAVVNLCLGFSNIFWVFVVLWAMNGWFQSIGAASSVVSISQWFSNNERGTRYGIWSTSHNIGEAITFVGTSAVVVALGWRWGFLLPGIICLVGAFLLYLFLYDRPESYGLPTAAVYKNDATRRPDVKQDLWALQLEVIKNPAVWCLGFASACFYFSRYAITSWGVLFLETQKGYTTVEAAMIISANPIFGILGTILSGVVSDLVFKGRRNVPALIFGFIYFISIAVFLLIPEGHAWVDAISMAMFGFALGGLLCYLGGLMAVDICSKQTSGAALGFVGVFSYLAAALQDIVSGHFIESGKIMVNGAAVYNFDLVIVFWISATILSIFFTSLVWNVKHKD